MSLSGASNFRDPWQTCCLSGKPSASRSMPICCSSTAANQEQPNFLYHFYLLPLIPTSHTTLLTVILKALCKGGAAAFLSFLVSAMVGKGSSHHHTGRTRCSPSSTLFSPSYAEALLWKGITAHQNTGLKLSRQGPDFGTRL